MRFTVQSHLGCVAPKGQAGRNAKPAGCGWRWERCSETCPACGLLSRGLKDPLGRVITCSLHSNHNFDSGSDWMTSNQALQLENLYIFAVKTLTWCKQFFLEVKASQPRFSWYSALDAEAHAEGLWKSPFEGVFAKKIFSRPWFSGEVLIRSPSSLCIYSCSIFLGTPTSLS